MEHETLQRRSMATIKTMGVNTYSQIVSAFRAQGDLTDEKLNILPVLQNAFGISRERHTAEIKRALYDEQLCEIASNIDPSSNTTNWEAEANYACPTVVHRPPNTKYVQLAEEILQTTPPTAIIQHPQPTTAIKLNHNLQKLVRDELKHDGIINATQQQSNANTTKFNLPNFNNNDIQGSKVVRLVRAKQTPKRETSLDNLIEVVQKELLRVNNQSSSSFLSSISSNKPPHRPPQTHSATSHRLIVPSVFPSSHPGSLTSQSNHSFKLARKRGFVNLNYSKKAARHKSFNHTDDDNDEYEQSIEDTPENIDEIVRDIVDELVALTSMKNAPYVVNMFTTFPTNTDSSMNKSQIIKTTTDLRNSISQTSPIKQQIHHPQLILQSQQPTTTTTNPTLFVTPRILNFQTVVPKPTTNIQIGNTKIILVSPSTTSTSSPANSLANNSVKLVKFTTNNSNSTSTNTNPTTITNNNNINTNSARSTLTLPKNVQIVIPSQTPSTIQLTRTNDEINKTTFRPVTTVPIGLKTCSIDHIPQAAQEVTITTSPTSSPPPLLQTNNNDLHQQTTLASIGEHNSNSNIRTSPNQDEMIKSVSVNFPLQSPQIPRTTSTHGPMIYRMTSVNPNVPVFRVRTTPTATTTPTPTPTSSTVMNKSMKTDGKPLSMSTTCYESKPTHSTPTSSGSVSVLACFKTTKKRNKERAIMPRPSTNDSSNDLSTIPISSTNSNTSLILNNDLFNPINSSPDYHRHSSTSSTSTRFYPQTSLSSIHSDDMNNSGLNHEQQNDLTTSSSSSIPITRTYPIEFQPIKSSDSLVEEKFIQGNKRLIDDDDDEEHWISEGENFLRHIIHNEYFDALEINDQEILRTKCDSIQTNLLNGNIPSKDDFIQSILQLKSDLSNENLHSFSTYIESELSKTSSESKRLRQQ